MQLTRGSQLGRREGGGRPHPPRLQLQDGDQLGRHDPAPVGLLLLPVHLPLDPSLVHSHYPPAAAALQDDGGPALAGERGDAVQQLGPLPLDPDDPARLGAPVLVGAEGVPLQAGRPVVVPALG